MVAALDATLSTELTVTEVLEGDLEACVCPDVCLEALWQIDAEPVLVMSAVRDLTGGAGGPVVVKSTT